jgi:hypothetical protein
MALIERKTLERQNLAIGVLVIFAQFLNKIARKTIAVSK